MARCRLLRNKLVAITSKITFSDARRIQTNGALERLDLLSTDKGKVEVDGDKFTLQGGKATGFPTQGCARNPVLVIKMSRHSRKKVRCALASSPRALLAVLDVHIQKLYCVQMCAED